MQAQTNGTPQQLATVLHAPQINGRVEGSVQLLSGEAVNFNSGATLTGDFLVPGTPAVQLNGTPNWQGRQTGTGSTSPTGWQITINSGVSLRYLVNRTNPVSLGTVTVPSNPTGTRQVTINSPNDANGIGNWATVKDLTLNSGAGNVTVPAGTYGSLTASTNNNTGLVFGVSGATQASVYNLQTLTINSGAQLSVLGPVIINVRNQLNLAGNATLGVSAHPEWVTLNVSSAGVTVNSGGTLYGSVLAPERAQKGSNLLLLQGDLASNTSGEAFLPLASLSAGTQAIEFDLDILATDRGFVPLYNQTIELRYSDERTEDYGTGSDGGYNDYNRAQPLYLPYTPFIQAGADTGYAARSGFRRMRIEIPAYAAGKKGYLYFKSSPQLPYTYEGYGAYTLPGASSALLVDRFSFVRGTGEPANTYASTSGDHSELQYLPGSQTYERRYKDGSVQTFDATGRQTAWRDRQGNQTTYAYTDATGSGQAFDLASVTDPVGLVTTLGYSGGKLASITDPAGRQTVLQYANGFLTRIVNPDGSTRTFGYNAQGRVSSQQDALGHARQYFYDPNSGRLAKVVRADGASYSYQPQQARSLNDGAAGSFTSPLSILREQATVFTDPLGNAGKTTLNGDGRPTLQTNALGEQTTVSFDWDLNPKRVVQANGNQVSTGFDGKGNLTSTYRAGDGARTALTYEPDYNLLATATDALGHNTLFEYDALGNLTRLNDNENHVSTRTYNAAGQVLTSTDPLGHVTQMTYNARGLMDSATDALGRRSTFAYDAAGNVTTMTDPAGRVTTTRHDAMNRPVQMTAADGGVTSYTYDLNGDPIALTDPNGHARRWSYDVRRRPQVLTDALGRTTQLSYDAMGNLKSRTRRDGTVISFQYDALNRPSQIGLPTLSNGVPADTVSYAYDHVGNVTRVTDSDSTIANTYDVLSHLTQTAQTYGGQTQTLGYGYDVRDRRTGMTDALGATTYRYDDLNRLSGLTDPGGRAFGFGYDAASRATTLDYANGVQATLGYDEANELLGLNHRNAGGGAVARAGYTYNVTGTRASEAREDGNVRRFGYDAVDRMLSSVNSGLPAGRDEAFGYDVGGNRTDAARQYDAADEVSGDAAFTYGFDAEGNLVSRTSRSAPGQVTSYVYDAMNRLVQVQTAGGAASVMSYAYDALGRRVAKSVGGVTTRYVLDGANVRLELDAAGGVVAANTHAGLDRLLVRDQGSASYFLHGDGLGSTAALTNSSGQVVERDRYGAYGQLEVLNPDGSARPSNQPSQPFTYTGREWEPETGLYFYRNRFYAPSLGRFLNPDPSGEQGGINLYAYAGGDPVSMTDPLGLAPGDLWDPRSYATVGQELNPFNLKGSFAQQALSISDSMGGMLAGDWNQVSNAYKGSALGQTDCNQGAHAAVEGLLALSGGAALGASATGIWAAAELPTFGASWYNGHLIYSVTSAGETTFLHGMFTATGAIGIEATPLLSSFYASGVSIEGIPILFPGVAAATGGAAFNCVTAAGGALRRGVIGF